RTDDAVFDGRWPVAPADEMGDPKGRLDSTPSLRGKIDRDKEVAREQRTRDGLDLAGVAAAFEVARQIDGKSLPAKMIGGLGFAVDMRLHDEPARIGLGRDHPTAPSGDARRPRSSGASTF